MSTATLPLSPDIEWPLNAGLAVGIPLQGSPQEASAETVSDLGQFWGTTAAVFFPSREAETSPSGPGTAELMGALGIDCELLPILTAVSSEPMSLPALLDLRAPAVEVSVGARPYLTDQNVQMVFHGLTAMCLNQANQLSVGIERLTLETKSSREERWIELVLRIFVPITLAQGMALWNAIGETIDEWMPRLPEARQRILAEQFAVFVEPTATDGF